MAPRLHPVACAAVLALAGCSSSRWAGDNHPGGSGVPQGGAFEVLFEAVHKMEVASDDGRGRHDCMAACPTGLTCDEQTGECARPSIAPPKGGPRAQ